MKILSTMAISMLALTACAQSYTITGKADANAEGKMAYLVDQNTAAYVDSCAVKDGAFKFEGEAATEKLFELNIDKKRRSKAMVLVAPGTVATVDLTVRPATVSDNGGYNDKYAALNNSIAEAGSAMDAKMRQLMAEGKSQNEAMEAMEGDIDAFYGLYHKAIEENKDNILGATIVAVVARQFYPTLEELDSVIAKVKYAGEMVPVKVAREGLLKAEATKEGKMFTDFSGFALDGAASKLSDYVGKGKYVLVDFWASWCGPCKGEIPNLIELQNKFGGDKFTVLGVNVWDEEAKFKAALAEEGITYPQIYIPRDNKDNATELYGIQGIPQIILFAPDGTIVKRNLRGDAMKAFVAEQMK
ncbi:MAG: TlpA disulfide reductase family protein [Bacteroidales bacterium]|nr:TlpA disulfide reductase family protein [Bacteroidales bacterium]